MFNQSPRRETAGGFFLLRIDPSLTVGTIPFPRRTRRLSLRYYLFDGDALWRIPHRLHRALLSGEVSLPQYANSKQKVVEVFIWTGLGTARTIEARGVVLTFNAKGSIDLAEAAEVMGTVIGGSRPRRLDKNILDIGPVIRTRRLSEHKWKLPAPVLRAIMAHISGTGRVRALRPATTE
jgi:hypothetical protein